MSEIILGILVELVGGGILELFNRRDSPVLTMALGTVEEACEAALRDLDLSGLTAVDPSFWSSDECRTTTSHLVLACIGEPPVEVFDLVHRECASALRRTQQLSDQECRRVFEQLLASAHSAFLQLVTEGLVVEDDLRSYALGYLTQVQLSAIERNIKALVDPEVSRDAVDKFVADFRRQTEFDTRRITPPNLGPAHPVDIDDLYVEPNLLRVSGQKDAQNDSDIVVYPDFPDKIYRTVLLGDPGAGKSTLSRKIAHDYATGAISTGQDLLPIIVVVRKFADERKKHPQSIAEYIAMDCRSTYQVPCSGDIVEFILLNGKALVIFDGLDELTDTSFRQDVVREVEAFCNFYPATSVLTTSRKIGYDQAPLDDDVFQTFRLLEYDNDQVAKYVNNWFAVQSDLLMSVRGELAASFLRESEAVSDLRSNGLMLALLCNIYRGENYIPTNRPAVYEKCATMLFERWDATRNIHVPLPIESLVGAAMMHLAFETYTSDLSQSGVTRTWLVARTVKYLLGRGRYLDEEEARAAAEAFVDFCTGRAWVFTDVGLADDGEALFGFTHRTFLEYFAARDLVRSYPRPVDLLPILLPHIQLNEWDVVAQLAVQIQDGAVEDGASDFLLGVIKKAQDLSSDDIGIINLLSFVVRTLRFSVPSITVVDGLVLTSLRVGASAERSLTVGAADRWDSPWNSPTYRGLWEGMQSSTSENHTNVMRSMWKVFESNAHKSDLSSFIAEVLLVRPTSHFHATIELNNAWEAWWNQTIQELWAVLLPAVEASLALSLWAFRRGKLSLENLIQLHGLGPAIALRPESRVLGISALSLLDMHLVPFLSEEYDQLDLLAADLRRIGELAFESMPWPLPEARHRSGVDVWGMEPFDWNRSRAQVFRTQIPGAADARIPDGVELAGVVLLLGAFERVERSNAVDASIPVQELALGALEFCRPILLARTDTGHDDSIDWDRLAAISPELVDFVLGWVAGSSAVFG